MANIYDMNAAIDKPNFLAAALGGLQAGQQQRQLREQRADQATLRQLAPQIMGGDNAAFEQAATISPEAAGQFRQAGNAKWDAIKGAVRYVKQAQASNNPAAVQTAWTAVRPYIERVTGVAPPADFATAAPHFATLEAKLATIEGGQTGTVQSAQVLANGNIAYLTRDGRLIDTGQPAAPTTQVIDQPGGVPFLAVTSRGQVGQSIPIGPGGQAPTPPATGDGLPVVFDQGPATAPPQVQQALTQRPWTANTPDIVGGQAAPVPLRTPTQAEVEAAKTRARLQAEIDYAPQQAQAAGLTVAAQEAARTAALPAQEAAKAAGAGQAQAAKDRATAQVELEQMLPKVQSEADRTLKQIDEVLNHRGREMATGLSSLNPINSVPGSPGYDFRVRLNQLKGGTFLQGFQSLKGGGAVTQIEGQKAEQAIARLEAAQSEAEFIDALEDYRQVVAAMPSSIQRRIMDMGAAAPPTGGERIITSPDGRRWRVVGGDPNDPDVEEVR